MVNINSPRFTRIVLISAILFSACPICLSTDLVIDNFQKKGQINNLGHSRKCYRDGEHTPDGFQLKASGFLYQSLTFDRSHTDIRGKAIQLTYTIRSNDYVRKLFIEQAKKSVYRLPKPSKVLELRLGTRNQIVVPISQFAGLNPTLVTRIVAWGSMLIHQMDLINDPNVLPLPENGLMPLYYCHPIKSANLLVDDFLPSNNPLVNTLGQPRMFTETLEIDSGFVSLWEPNDYIAEFFAPETKPMNIRYMSVRLVYSAFVSDEFKLTLLHEKVNEKMKLSVCTVKFEIGTSLEKLVPFSKFLEPGTPSNKLHGYAIMVHGPLMLHQTELVMDQEALSRIKTLPSPTNDPVGLLPTPSGHFDMKYAYFQNALQLLKIPYTFQMQLYTTQLIEQVQKVMDIHSFRMDLDVYFHYLPRVDKAAHVGLLLTHLGREFSTPLNELFQRSHNIKKQLVIIPKLYLSSKLIDRYRFAGQVIGMTILNRGTLSISFESLIFKLLLDKPVRPSDMRYISPSIATEIDLLLSGKSKDIRTMSVTLRNTNNKRVIVDLVKNGRDINVNAENVNEYVNLYTEWHSERLIGTQANALREGLYQVIPKDLIQVFDKNELQHVLCKKQIVPSSATSEWSTIRIKPGFAQ